MAPIRIRDVGPRDGLQSERPVEPGARAALAIALADAGVAEIEAASFVSPAAVPAMAAGGDVLAAVREHPSDTVWWVLVPNRRGAELARERAATHLTVTISASEGYSLKNVGRSVDEALTDLAAIAAVAADTSGAESPAVLDVVISCAFGSPFDDVADPSPVRRIVGRVADCAPAARITLADTTGAATPRRIAMVIDALPEPARDDLGLHLHDTRGTALANALAGIDLGVTRFDTSTGGLGGSPFAPGAGGNLATEDLVLMLADLGHTTGIDLDAILAIARALPELIGHPVPSRVSSAGRLPDFAR